MARAALGRNAPCPCGSGRKYRHCHGRRRSDPARRTGRATLLLVFAGALVAGLLVVRGLDRSRPPLQRVMNAPAGASLPPAGKLAEGGLEPAPFTYDARNNRHWDPDHHHWHFGPPPSQAERAARVARAAGPTVEPRDVAALAAPVPTAADSSESSTRSR
jgi:hypothetical protein